jgi:hypothetical protein
MRFKFRLIGLPFAASERQKTAWLAGEIAAYQRQCDVNANATSTQRQWLIIHGRRPLDGFFSASGRALPPLAPASAMREPEQQLHAAG